MTGWVGTQTGLSTMCPAPIFTDPDGNPLPVAGDVLCSEVLAICPGGAGTGDCVAP